MKNQEVRTVDGWSFFIDIDDLDPSSEQIVKILAWCDAIWTHDGDPAKPHAELTSGMCSNGFFDVLRALRYPNVCEYLGRCIAKKANEDYFLPDVVVGSPYADITLSYEVAKALRVPHAFVEKDAYLVDDPNYDPGKKIAWKMVWKRLNLPAGTRVLRVEELITTSKTVNAVTQAIVEAHPAEGISFCPVVYTVVHRPPKLPAEYDNFKVVALLEKEVWAVSPEDCSLCEQGSKRLRPKSNWKELTGKS